MKTLRVLHIYRTYFPETQGGAQKAIRQLCLATQPLGVDNTIFTLAKNLRGKYYGPRYCFHGMKGNLAGLLCGRVRASLFKC